MTPRHALICHFRNTCPLCKCHYNYYARLSLHVGAPLSHMDYGYDDHLGIPVLHRGPYVYAHIWKYYISNEIPYLSYNVGIIVYLISNSVSLLGPLIPDTSHVFNFRYNTWLGDANFSTSYAECTSPERW